MANFWLGKKQSVESFLDHKHMAYRLLLGRGVRVTVGQTGLHCIHRGTLVKLPFDLCWSLNMEGGFHCALSPNQCFFCSSFTPIQKFEEVLFLSFTQKKSPLWCLRLGVGEYRSWTLLEGRKHLFRIASLSKWTMQFVIQTLLHLLN